jgi:hypothetical protein
MTNVFFILKCKRCSWTRKSTGTSDDLKDLVEVRRCTNCGGGRKFKCPKCAEHVKMTRVICAPDDPALKELYKNPELRNLSNESNKKESS